MITADPHSKLGRLCRMVAAMKPGERLEIDRSELMDIPSFEHNGAIFRPVDRILGNIVGSAWTHSFEERFNGNVVFSRHEETEERRYKEPDHDIRLHRLEMRDALLKGDEE